MSSTTGRRAPTVHEVLEGGWLVRHTQDVGLAVNLLRHHLVRNERWSSRNARAAITADAARLRWYRATPCLRGSYGYSEGWKYQYTVAKPGGRGAFRVVEWWLG